MMLKRLLILIVLGAVILTSGLSTLTAQDDAWTCDDGPNDILNAARALANEDKDYQAAYDLALHAQIVCMDDHQRSMSVRSFVNQMGIRLDIFDFENMQPGLIDMGDFKLFMTCMGEGSPTVIFEHGWDGSGADWDTVMPAIGTITQACSYSRRGTGRSSAFSVLDRDAVRTAQDQVDDLALLLETAGIEPPYVIVAHSYGGFTTLLFTDQHPEWVQGIVLVDAGHPDYLDTIWLPQEPDICDELDTGSDPERIDFCTSTMQAMDIRSYGDRPLAIVTAGINSSPEAEQWNALQEDYLTFSTNAQRTIAEYSNHFIMSTEPEMVIQAVLWVLDEVRAANTD